MEMNELTTLWKDQDHQLDKMIMVNKTLVTEVSLYKVRARLGHIKWSAAFSIILYLLFMGFLSDFIMANYHITRFLIPGLALVIYSAAGISLNIYRLVLYYRIHSFEPVIKTQMVSEKLRYLDLLEKNSLYIAIPLFWIAFVIVVVRALTGYDLYLQSTWLVLSAAGSAVIAVIVVFLLKKFPDKRLRDTIGFLRELAENEQ